ncbi:hypothetical protein PSV08DRAFT_403691 [Bipolaris maydis]|uniref:uncharacterized protein n=1 Tax=Cochliobolus heterostrophus TaxID=5016 RepID=UPI0024D67AD0|nr:hypothetical protein J3E73DRAFT_425426 [Bipolaris maydis]KAJ6268279.1 hypothetical protein PSV08DRAFT_403691 [Bipolaris maydis]KAJ6278527.1 hypothetical protein J3E71DRAFT_401719 [Bipolaris maydis]
MSSAQTQAQTLTTKPMYVTDSRTHCLLCLVSTAQRSAAPTDLAVSRQKQGRLWSSSAYHASSSLQPATDCRTSKTLDATDDGGGDGGGGGCGHDGHAMGGGGGGIGRGGAGDNTAVAWVWGKQESQRGWTESCSWPCECEHPRQSMDEVSFNSLCTSSPPSAGHNARCQTTFGCACIALESNPGTPSANPPLG